MAGRNPPHDADIQRYWELDKPRLPTVPRQRQPRWWDPIPDLLKVPWLLPLIGAAIYELLRISYSRFYDSLGLKPEDVGLGYTAILEQSLVALLLLFLLVLSIVYILFLIPNRLFETTWPFLAFTVIVIAVTVYAVRRASFQDGLITPSADLSAFLYIALIFLAFGSRIVQARYGFHLRERFTSRSGLRVFWDSYFKIGPYLLSIIIVLNFLVFLLIEFITTPDSVAYDVSSGKTAHHILFGQSVFSFGGDPATVYWPANTPAALTTPPKGRSTRCLMYLGQANGTTVFYDVDNHASLRVPANMIIVQVHQDWKHC